MAAEIAPQDPPPEPSVAVPGYRIGERIGEGGFGEVFRARHEVIGRDVAIKVLHARCSTDPIAVARFVAEARAVNRISHPGIVQIHDLGTLEDGRPYCVMDLIDGTTLRDLLRERGRLPLAEALPILRGIAEAVDAAHGAGVAHRDLKPDNVFVLAAGTVKLIDFGLAKLVEDDAASVTVTGAVFGTPMYMSPEQCRGGAIDHRTDCYSFGVLAYHVLTGEPPWRGDALELALHHLNDPPPPPSQVCPELPTYVDRVVRALMAKAPADRPSPLVVAVDALAGDTELPRALHLRARRWWLAGALAVVSVGGVAIALATRSPRDPAPQPEATPTWSIRAVPEVPKDFAVALEPEGEAVLYVDSRGATRRRLDGPSTTPILLVDPATVRALDTLPDGRLLVSRDQPDGSWIWREDPTTGTRERITTGRHARSGPDGQIAFDRGGQIFTRSLATQRETLVASVAGRIGGIAWSTDGRRFAWMLVAGASQRVEVLDTVDGSVRLVPAKPNLVDNAMPLAFVGASEIVFCDRLFRLQQLDLATGIQRTLRQLAPQTNACSIRATPDGGRVAVSTGGYGLVAAALPLAEPARGWTRVAPGAVEDWTSDGRLVVGAWGPPHPAGHRTPDNADREMPAVTLHALDGTPGTPLERCPGSAAVRRRGAELLFNVNIATGGALAMQLVHPGDCAVVDTWTLPDAPGWAYPKCGRELCATARAEAGTIWVWTLRRGTPEAHELVKLAGGSPEISISPDDRWIAVNVFGGDPLEGDVVWVIDAKTGSMRKLHAGPWPGTHRTDGRAWTTSWSATSDAIYVGSSESERATITRVPLEGAPEPLWSGTQGYLGLFGRTSADGAWLGANLLDIKTELLVLER